MHTSVRTEHISTPGVSDAVEANAPKAAVAWGTLPRSRHARVVAALATVVTLSMVDLYLTLVFATNTGMIESNPIARAIMETGSAWGVVLWKFATVAVAVALLYRARLTRIGELGAWLCVAVLTWLTCHWITFSREASAIPSVMTSPWLTADANFVRIGTTP